MLSRSKAPITTMIIAGERCHRSVPTKSPNATTSRNRKIPAQDVEMRVRARDAFTLIII